MLAASVTVENIVTVTGGSSVHVPLVAEGNVLLGPDGVRVPLRRSVVPEGVKGVPVGPTGIGELAVMIGKPEEGPVPVGPTMVDEFPVGKGKLADGAVPVGKRRDEFAVGKEKLADGAVPVGRGRDELAVGKGKLADGAVPVAAGKVKLLLGKGKLADGKLEVPLTLGTPVLKGIDTVELKTGVPVGNGWLPERSPLGKEPENVFGAVPVGPTGSEALEKMKGVVTGVAVPERSPSVEVLEVVTEPFVEGKGKPLGELVKGTYTPLEMLNSGMLVEYVTLVVENTTEGATVPLVGDGLGDAVPERPAFDEEPEKGDEAVK